MDRLPKTLRDRIMAAINALAPNPRPPGVQKLRDDNNLYRIRVGDYRIIYQIIDQEVVVVVVRIGHRREVYRKR